MVFVLPWVKGTTNTAKGLRKGTKKSAQTQTAVGEGAAAALIFS